MKAPQKYNLCPGLPSLSYFFGNGIHFLEREPRSGAGTVPGRAGAPPRGCQIAPCGLGVICPHRVLPGNATDKLLTFPAVKTFTSSQPFNRHSQKIIFASKPPGSMHPSPHKDSQRGIPKTPLRWTEALPLLCSNPPAAPAWEKEAFSPPLSFLRFCVLGAVLGSQQN